MILTWSIGGMILIGEDCRSVWGEPVTLPLCLPVTRGLVWDCTAVTAVRGRLYDPAMNVTVITCLL